MRKEADSLKTHSSVMLMFIDEKQALFTLQDLNIAKKRCDTFKFNEVKLTTQCMKCLKYEHLHYMCKAKSNYQICAKDHETRLYKCHVCKSTKICVHVFIKCVNCGENH